MALMSPLKFSQRLLTLKGGPEGKETLPELLACTSLPEELKKLLMLLTPDLNTFVAADKADLCALTNEIYAQNKDLLDLMQVPGARLKTNMEMECQLN
jgi:hypothetical protein